MASNIYDNTLDINNNVNVNSFDWSNTSHITGEAGRIMPVGCWFLPPKSTFRANSVDFGLQAMPTTFPIQTPVRARLNFFKMECRAMNEDFTDMVSGTRTDIEEPYIALNDPKLFSLTFGTSKLGDYLGLPTKVSTISDTTPVSSTGVYTDYNYLTRGSEIIYDSGSSRFKDAAFVITQNSSPRNIAFKVKTTGLGSYTFAICAKVTGATNGIVLATHSFDFVLENQTFDLYVGEYDWDFIIITDRNKLLNPERFATITQYGLLVEQEVSADNTTYGLSSSPHKISAYPFRMYEAVYNCYYRDSRNNPYVLNGKPVYNRWLPTMKSGADPTVYTLHNCNWERDAFTTAVQNPQQGIKAPLAGITTYQSSRTLDTGEISTEVKTALVTEDGKKYALDFQTDDENTALTGVKYTELTSSADVRPVTTLSDLANSGLSIETLRYVNAYQKYLELNMRKGFSYRDIMQGRWDIDIRFDELLMPTFIGGVSRDINMNAVTQTVDQGSASDTSYESSLGSQSGIMGVYGQSDNNIECFCDEASYIMAVLTIVPTPIYSQLTPKYFFYRDLLDTPQPEFQNIGFQPIYKKELNIFDKDGGDEVFGYQRPWYEFCQQYDTCHGAFRDTLGNFLMKRTFLGTPELSSSFLTIDPAQLSKVFSVTKVGNSPIYDHWYGYVHFDVTAKLPINRVAIPRLD